MFRSFSLFAVAVLGSGTICLSPAPAAPDAPPNIIVMMADDMGLGDTSAYQDFTGNPDDVQLSTPNMERLARMGVRFTDAHTPSSRCSPTRYALLTGRYPWRSRLKHWVLFGVQADPMIEPDRPTIATMLRDRGYHTAMVGKWHVGLRYRSATGMPAAGWTDADLTQPLFDTPLDHGFQLCYITSRSHGTSGPAAGTARNKETQKIGPGHVHGRVAVGATGQGKKLVDDGPNAYVLMKLGSRHSDHAILFLQDHVGSPKTQATPFFLYYACNSNHGPYTPDEAIGGQPVAGAGRTKAGQPTDARLDYVYENDVALGRLLDYLEKTNDPRQPTKKLVDNTIVIFTSDNGADKDLTSATGPFRSNKGSVYEGGHRVPFIVCWPDGGVGDGNAADPGRTSDAPIGLQDLFATFAEIVGQELPDLRRGETGAEDSQSVLAAWRDQPFSHGPMIFNDHKQAEDPAAAAIRMDNPIVNGRVYHGKWKLFADASLLRAAEVHPVELYDLAADPEEQHDRLAEPPLQPLVGYLSKMIHRHRTVGGHRAADWAPEGRIVFDWCRETSERDGDNTFRVGLASRFSQSQVSEMAVTPDLDDAPTVTMTLEGVHKGDGASAPTFSLNARGLGLRGGEFEQVDQGEAIMVRFDKDVLVESVAIVAGNGVCGGFYQMGDREPLQIYCVDADVDKFSKDQSGILSDLGVLPAGKVLRLDSRPFLDVEDPGRWRLAFVAIRVLP